jgi:hypothetical protein
VEILVLLEVPGHDRARAKLAEKGFDVDQELARAVNKVTVREVNLWDPGAVGRVLVDNAEQLTKRAKGPLWANISTGPNPWCVAASIAAMFADIQVFHVARNGYDIVRLPVLRHAPPTPKERLLLRAIPSDGGHISGTLLKKRLREVAFFEKSTSTKPAKNREQGQLTHHMKRLLEWGAIERDHGTTRRHYWLGPAGRVVQTMFH